MTGPSFAQAALRPDGPLLLRLPPPPPRAPRKLSPLPQQLLGGKGGDQGGADGAQISYLFVLEVGRLLIIGMGLYLNKNQFLAAPPLLLGSVGAPC